ncbi:MAG TPA: septum formation initiator family protein [Terriglobia bacterium]|nr:septum formation initiator family protein [Terriglobia bacterium]
MHGLIVRVALSVAGLLTFAILVLAVFNDNGYLAVRHKRQKLSSIEAENAAIIAEIQRLSEENERLRSDPSLIEKIAREELKLVRPGEVVIEVSPATRN